MNRQVIAKCIGVVVAVLWLLNNSYPEFIIDVKSGVFRGAPVNRKMIAIHQEPSNSADITSTPYQCDFSEFVQKFKPEELEINCDNIHEVKLGQLIGYGSYAEVFEGEWHGRKVALRKRKGKHFISKRNLDNTLEAAAVMFQLREAPNVVHLLGWCNATIVMNKADTILKKIMKRELSVARSLEISIDIAKGVQQLHELPMGLVAHGDIKPTQFLVDEQGTILLGDFHKIHYIGYSNAITKCQFKWRDGNIVDEKQDIHDIALIMWQLQSQIPPDIGPVTTEKMKDYPQAMQDLIVEAWDTDPVKRPSATEMVHRIEAILRSYKELDDFIAKSEIRNVRNRKRKFKV